MTAQAVKPPQTAQATVGAAWKAFHRHTDSCLQCEGVRRQMVDLSMPRATDPVSRRAWFDRAVKAACKPGGDLLHEWNAVAHATVESFGRSFSKPSMGSSGRPAVEDW